MPDRKGLSLRFRRGYYARDHAVLTDEAIYAEIDRELWSPLEENGIAFSVRVAGKHADSLQLQFAIAPQTLSFQHKDDHWNSSFDIVIAQLDGEGRPLSTAGDTVQLALKGESYERALKSGVSVTRPVKPAAKAKQLRVVIADRDTRSVGSVIIPMANLF